MHTEDTRNNNVAASASSIFNMTFASPATGQFVENMLFVSFLTGLRVPPRCLSDKISVLRT